VTRETQSLPKERPDQGRSHSPAQGAPRLGRRLPRAGSAQLPWPSPQLHGGVTRGPWPWKHRLAPDAGHLTGGSHLCPPRAPSQMGEDTRDQVASIPRRDTRPYSGSSLPAMQWERPTQVRELSAPGWSELGQTEYQAQEAQSRWQGLCKGGAEQHFGKWAHTWIAPFLPIPPRPPGSPRS
jgi:hypothetical protein